MAVPASFTVTALMATANNILRDADFKVAEVGVASPWRAASARVYEDSYSVVCVAVYETWADLDALWMEDQATLVDLISNRLTRAEAKAWDGYLVLLTPSVVPTTDLLKAVRIQRDTLYVRKLLADGSELGLKNVVGQVLLPLLPLQEYDVLESSDVFETLLSLLTNRGIEQGAAQAATTAFQQQRPIVAAIHEFMTNHEAHKS